MSGGYDPTETDPDSKLVQAMVATDRKSGVDPLLWPRLPGSWPRGTVKGERAKLAGGRGHVQEGGGGPAPLAAARGLLARGDVHRRAAQAGGGPVRTGPRRRGP